MWIYMSVYRHEGRFYLADEIILLLLLFCLFFFFLSHVYVFTRLFRQLIMMNVAKKKSS